MGENNIETKKKRLKVQHKMRDIIKGKTRMGVFGAKKKSEFRK